MKKENIYFILIMFILAIFQAIYPVIAQTSKVDQYFTRTEIVTCKFEGSNEIESCFIDDEENNLSCTGKNECMMKVTGTRGANAVWKSSCGGYEYTTIDENNEEVIFNCNHGKVNYDDIKFSGFKYSSYECLDNSENFIKDQSCRSIRDIIMDAIDYCSNQCKDNKCGIKILTLTDSCYNEKIDNLWSDEILYNLNEKVKAIETPISKETIICKDSCYNQEKCINFGTRIKNTYCDSSGSLIRQFNGGSICDYNYMCESDNCLQGKCTKVNIFEKIINFFENLF